MSVSISRLGKVTQSAHLIAFYSIFNMTREENDAYLLTLTPQLTCKGEPIHTGHFNIEKNQVIRSDGEAFQQFTAAGKSVHNYIEAIVEPVHYILKIRDKSAFVIADCYTHSTHLQYI